MASSSDFVRSSKFRDSFVSMNKSPSLYSDDSEKVEDSSEKYDPEKIYENENMDDYEKFDDKSPEGHLDKSQDSSMSDFSDDENSLSKPTCAICLGRIKGKIGCPDAFDCEHSFCLVCILEWAKNNAVCPQDRKEFEKVFVREEPGGHVVDCIHVEVKTGLDAIPIPDDDPTFCEVCNLGDREDRLLLCDGCDLGYHLECLTPPLSHVPVEEWFCPCCEMMNVADVLEDVESDIPKPSNNSNRSAILPNGVRMIPRTRANERVLERINTSKKLDIIKKSKRRKSYIRRQRKKKNKEMNGQASSSVVQAFTKAKPFGSKWDDELDQDYNDGLYQEYMHSKFDEPDIRNPEARMKNAIEVYTKSLSTPKASYSGRTIWPSEKEVTPSSQEIRSSSDILSDILGEQSVLLSNSKDLALNSDRKLMRKSDIDSDPDVDKENVDVDSPSNPSKKKKDKKSKKKKKEKKGKKSRRSSYDSDKDSKSKYSKGEKSSKYKSSKEGDSPLKDDYYSDDENRKKREERNSKDAKEDEDHPKDDIDGKGGKSSKSGNPSKSSLQRLADLYTSSKDKDNDLPFYKLNPFKDASDDEYSRKKRRDSSGDKHKHNDKYKDSSKSFDSTKEKNRFGETGKFKDVDYLNDEWDSSKSKDRGFAQEKGYSSKSKDNYSDKSKSKDDYEDKNKYSGKHNYDKDKSKDYNKSSNNYADKDKNNDRHGDKDKYSDHYGSKGKSRDNYWDKDKYTNKDYHMDKENVRDYGQKDYYGERDKSKWNYGDKSNNYYYGDNVDRSKNYYGEKDKFNDYGNKDKNKDYYDNLEGYHNKAKYKDQYGNKEKTSRYARYDSPPRKGSSNVNRSSPKSKSNYSFKSINDRNKTRPLSSEKKSISRDRHQGSRSLERYARSKSKDLDYSTRLQMLEQELYNAKAKDKYYKAQDWDYNYRGINRDDSDQEVNELLSKTKKRKDKTKERKEKTKKKSLWSYDYYAETSKVRTVEASIGNDHSLHTMKIITPNNRKKSYNDSDDLILVESPPVPILCIPSSDSEEEAETIATKKSTPQRIVTISSANKSNESGSATNRIDEDKDVSPAPSHHSLAKGSPSPSHSVEKDLPRPQSEEKDSVHSAGLGSASPSHSIEKGSLSPHSIDQEFGSPSHSIEIHAPSPSYTPDGRPASTDLVEEKSHTPSPPPPTPPPLTPPPPTLPPPTPPHASPSTSMHSSLLNTSPLHTSPLSQSRNDNFSQKIPTIGSFCSSDIKPIYEFISHPEFISSESTITKNNITIPLKSPTQSDDVEMPLSLPGFSNNKNIKPLFPIGANKESLSASKPSFLNKWHELKPSKPNNSEDKKVEARETLVIGRYSPALKRKIEQIDIIHDVNSTSSKKRALDNKKSDDMSSSLGIPSLNEKIEVETKSMGEGSQIENYDMDDSYSPSNVLHDDKSPSSELSEDEDMNEESTNIIKSIVDKPSEEINMFAASPSSSVGSAIMIPKSAAIELDKDKEYSPSQAYSPDSPLMNDDTSRLYSPSDIFNDHSPDDVDSRRKSIAKIDDEDDDVPYSPIDTFYDKKLEEENSDDSDLDEPFVPKVKPKEFDESEALKQKAIEESTEKVNLLFGDDAFGFKSLAKKTKEASKAIFAPKTSFPPKDLLSQYESIIKQMKIKRDFSSKIVSLDPSEFIGAASAEPKTQIIKNNLNDSVQDIFAYSGVDEDSDNISIPSPGDIESPNSATYSPEIGDLLRKHDLEKPKGTNNIARTQAEIMDLPRSIMEAARRRPKKRVVIPEVHDEYHEASYTEKLKNNRAILEANVVDEAKKWLTPYYMDRCFTRPIFKEIISKIVSKVVGIESSTSVDSLKIRKMVDGYVVVYQHRERKKKRRTL